MAWQSAGNERVERRRIGEIGTVGAQSEHQREVVVDAPVVAGIQAVLTGFEADRRLRTRSIRKADAVLRRHAGFERHHRREEVVTVELGEEQVLELEDLVVRAEHDRVVAMHEREVVGELGDLLIERVRAGESLRAGVERGVLVGTADLDAGEDDRRGAVLTNALVADASLVVVVRAEHAVELRHRRVGFAQEGVDRSRKAETR